ncbi:hypothetical protein [Streptomyces rochei]|uniref:hypothetical protein n=1 Tax=Streptomyces rochei TaxID=1928 RepID=UPI0036791DDB
MPNYPFFYPKASDLMKDVKKNVTDNFKIIEPRNDITVIPAGGALPQSGNYNIGDRVFRNDPPNNNQWPSNYILVTKDVNWGWHWRPIQQIISPWVTVPANCIELTSDWEVHPTRLLQIALDSRGWCHWRGVIRTKVPGIPVNTSIVVFKNIPEGIRPNVNFMHTLSVSPIRSAAGKAGNVSGRIYCDNAGYSSLRFSNTNNGASQNVWFDGLHYQPGRQIYYSG